VVSVNGLNGVVVNVDDLTGIGVNVYDHQTPNQWLVWVGIKLVTVA